MLNKRADKDFSELSRSWHAPPRDYQNKITDLRRRVLLHQQAVSDLRKIEATIARSPERARGALHDIERTLSGTWHQLFGYRRSLWTEKLSRYFS